MGGGGGGGVLCLVVVLVTVLCRADGGASMGVGSGAGGTVLLYRVSCSVYCKATLNACFDLITLLILVFKLWSTTVACRGSPIQVPIQKTQWIGNTGADTRANTRLN